MAEFFPQGALVKVDVATQQLAALNREVGETFEAIKAHPYSIVSQSDTERRHYTFRLYPRWNPHVALRWGVHVGEIVHDLRSALDHIAFQLVRLNDADPDRWTWFPIFEEPPQGSFRDATCWTSRGGRHGQLLGMSDTAIATIEACQPYKGGDCKLLGLLDALWQIDKHRHLLPMLLVGETPEVSVSDAEILDSWIERDEEGTNVVHVIVEPGSDPKVDVHPKAPRDIAFGDGTAVIDQLLDTARFINAGVITQLMLVYP